MNHRVKQAAYNNAVWCDTVCRAHGRPGEFLGGLWINRNETPRFYPNAVTLADASEPTGQLEHIRDLVTAENGRPLAVKDSFSTLDLATLGFRILFEAQWICRPSVPLGSPAVLSEVEWTTVTGAPALAQWETAWCGANGDETPPNQTRVFLPPLLEDKSVAVIAAYGDQRIVAGAIANRTDAVVGISNMFVPPADGQRLRAGCIARVRDAFPGMLMVGYETECDLAPMAALGFETVGPLRVWVRP